MSRKCLIDIIFGELDKYEATLNGGLVYLRGIKVHTINNVEVFLIGLFIFFLWFCFFTPLA